MPTRYYNQPTKKELHFQSLQASEAIAKYAREVALERGWSYERAAEYIRAKHSDLGELELKGYVDEEKREYFEYTSHEAATLISEKAKALMKAKKISYAEAVNRVYANPANKEICRCYAQSD